MYDICNIQHNKYRQGNSSGGGAPFLKSVIVHVANIFEQQTMYNVYSYVNQDLNISVPGA